MKTEGKKKKRAVRFLSVLGVCLLFLLLGVILTGQRASREKSAGAEGLTLLEAEALTEKKTEAQERAGTGKEENGTKQRETKPLTRECLLLWEEQSEISAGVKEELEAVLTGMGAGFYSCPVENAWTQELGRQEKVVLAVTAWNSLGEDLFRLLDWVERGGQLYICLAPEEDACFRTVSSRLGIREYDTGENAPEGLRVSPDFMLGGGRDYPLSGVAGDCRKVSLSEDCQVYLCSADEKEIPLLWGKKLGEGRVVVSNLSFSGKECRGILGAAYSLLGEMCCYPVINGAAFYLDDFPMPMSGGEAESFYREEWWPYLAKLGEKYGFSYTGMLTETFDYQVKAPFSRNLNTDEFIYFGNQLLKGGGAIGLRGRNAVPLSTQEVFSQVPWYESAEDMRAALQEALDFAGELYPRQELRVYAPVGNVLSDEGRAVLTENFNRISAVAGVYLGGEAECVQEFGVASDGLTETPRIVRGCIPTEQMELAALSELNLHYVATQVQTPYEALEAAVGPERCLEGFEAYADWLFESAPDIRRLNGESLAAAVQRYDCLSVTGEIKGDSICLYLEGLEDGGQLFLRINEGGVPEEISGGSLIRLTDSLYLIEADGSVVEIRRGEG